jgi:hypothetical protein
VLGEIASAVVNAVLTSVAFLILMAATGLVHSAGVLLALPGCARWSRYRRHRAVVERARRSACADRVVSQAKPVIMLARWKSPPSLTSRDDWPKPAPARTIDVSMVTAVPAL